MAGLFVVAAFIATKVSINKFWQGEDIQKKPKIQNEATHRIDTYLETSEIPYRCSSPTRGDGNCWWRAIADTLKMEEEDAHKILRTKVCENVKRCPEDWKNNIIDLEFKGKPRGLKDLVYRQKKDGQFTDDKGIITQATAYYTGRNIKIFSETGGGVPTMLEGGGEANSCEPLVVFFHNEHFQALVPFQQRRDKE